jgi:adenine deaminase
VNLNRLILVTDSMSPDDVAQFGYMDHVVRRAIQLGLSPVQALQSATLHPAAYSGLEQEIGGIAPGRLADMILIEDLEHFHIREVLIGGRRVAHDGEVTAAARPVDAPRSMLYCLRVNRAITAETFRVRSPSARPRTRVMELISQTITAERIIPMNTAGAVVCADAAADILKIAMFDRHGRCEDVAFGFLKGMGVSVGAIGLTTNLDENTLLIAGMDDADMARCANALLESGGGIAIVDHGQIQERIDFPFGGIFSLAPWREVGRRLATIQRRLQTMGSPFDKPIFALNFLPFVTLPALRITARGLVDVKRRQIVPLFAEDQL